MKLGVISVKYYNFRKFNNLAIFGKLIQRISVLFFPVSEELGCLPKTRVISTTRYLNIFPWLVRNIHIFDLFEVNNFKGAPLPVSAWYLFVDMSQTFSTFVRDLLPRFRRGRVLFQLL